MQCTESTPLMTKMNNPFLCLRRVKASLIAYLNATKQAFNITEGAYGDVSILINDGDNTTSWQAKYNDTTGKVLVDLKSF